MTTQNMKTRLSRIRFYVGVLGEVRDALSGADDVTFELLLDALMKFENVPKVVSAFRYFRDSADDDEIETFMQSEYDRKSAEFLKICTEIDENPQLLETCREIFLTVLRVYLVMTDKPDEAVNKICRHLCRWPQIFEEDFFMRVSSEIPFEQLLCFVRNLCAALSEYQKVCPPNNFSSKQKINDFLDSFLSDK